MGCCGTATRRRARPTRHVRMPVGRQDGPPRMASPADCCSPTRPACLPRAVDAARSGPSTACGVAEKNAIESRLHAGDRLPTFAIRQRSGAYRTPSVAAASGWRCPAGL